MTAHDLLDGLAGLVGMVERNHADIVMQDVGLDDAVEELTSDEAKFTVDGCGRTTSVGPGSGCVVWERWIGVLQECNRHLRSCQPKIPCSCLHISKLTQPVVHPEVRSQVPHEKVRESIRLADPEKNRSGDQKTQVAEEDQLGILCFVQGAVGIEMVDTTAKAILLADTTSFTLDLMLVVTSDIGQQVHGPASQLLGDQGVGGVERSLFGKFIKLVKQVAFPRGPLLPGGWNEDHISFHVTSCFVVLAVRDLPREIRHQQRRVTKPAHSIVQNLALGEGLVTTFVGQHPQASTEETLHNGVQKPETSSQRGRWDRFWRDESVEEVEGGRQRDDVSCNIVETSGRRPVETTLGDGIVNVFDGVIWDLEGVAIGVNQLLLFQDRLLLLKGILRRKRGQRG